MILSTSVFCNDTATTEIYTDGHTLSLHDTLPISVGIEQILAAAHLDVIVPGQLGRPCRRVEQGGFGHYAKRIDQRMEGVAARARRIDRKSTRLNSSH